MFHKHHFQEIERFYVEPIMGDSKGYSAKELIKIAGGQTTILYQCIEQKICQEGGSKVLKGCGETYKEEILGKSLKNET